MAAFKNFLSQNRRHCTSDHPNLNRHLSYLFRRKFSSSETTDPNPEQSPSPNSRKQPLPIQPVSYPTKPKSEQQQQTSNVQQASLLDELDSATSDSRRSWTRDEMRYMKDSSSSSVSPVSYQARVAPLPEDRVGEEGRRNEELERERRRIDNNDDDDKWRAMRERGVLRYGKRGEEEEDANLPLPRMIKAAGENGGGDQESKKKKSKVVYDLKEAICLVKADARVTFDETLEAHVRMTPELRRTDLKLSGFVRFPHGFGKTYRVAVFAEGAAADEARDAGADVVGGPELVENIQTGQLKIDFDKCISTPSMMEHVKKLSRNLKQLMPDPKKGTVTNDMSKTVKEAKEKGVLFKKDKTAIVHVGLGKVSFAEEALRENIGAFVNALLLAKPAGLKKSSKYAGYVDSFHICSTMGSSFPITIQSLSMAADRYNRLQLRGQPEST